MKITEAIAFIRDLQPGSQPQLWADLGCGSGIFSRALASLLPDKSTVYCCDREQQIEFSLISGVRLEFVQLDFERQILKDIRLDGIIMANSLHYILNQKETLLKWKNLLNPEGKFIVIEYDTTDSSHWIPFPVSFARLKELWYSLGIDSVQLLGARKSMYHNMQMYASMVRTGE